MVRYSLVVLAALAASVPSFAGWADGLFDEQAKDFGSVARGPELSHPFRIKNTTGGVVTVGSVRVSCGRCSSISLAKYQLGPGEETTVTVKMYTAQWEGPKVIYAYVQFLQPQFDEVRLTVTANSRQDVQVIPDTLAFGAVRRGAAPEVKTNVTLYGDTQTRVTALETESHYIQAEIRETRRGAGDVAYELTARVRDDIPTGRWFSDVWLKTSNPALPRLRVPLTVEVSPALNVNPSAVALGEVPVGETVERKVILRGSKPFRIIRVEGSDGQLEVVRPADESKEVQVLKVRLNAKEVGPLNHTVKVFTDLKEEGEVDFQARGEVVPAKVVETKKD